MLCYKYIKKRYIFLYAASIARYQRIYFISGLWYTNNSIPICVPRTFHTDIFQLMIPINANTCITIPEHVWVITCWHLHLHTVHPIKVLPVVAGSALVLDPEKSLLASTTNPIPILILIAVVLRYTLIQHITPLKPHRTAKYHQLTSHTIPLMLHRTWSTNSCGNGVCAHHTSTIYTIKL